MPLKKYKNSQKNSRQKAEKLPVQMQDVWAG